MQNFPQIDMEGETLMSDIVNVAVDGMGGDNAPKEAVKGAVDALNANRNLKVTLLGNEDQIKAELSGYTYPEDRLDFVPTTEVIDMAEPPVQAIRNKKDSSIVVGMKKVKAHECDAFVTAGSTGATLVGGQLLVGRIKGIRRAPLAPLIPTSKGPALLIDCGANMDARPEDLVQFAQMGAIYMESIVGLQNPRVALYNVGTEEEKGNAVVKEAYQQLKALDDINFIGNIESREIPNGGADVVVCDAFTGNAILKMFEGTAKVIAGEIKEAVMSSTRSKIGGLLLKPALKKTLKKFSVSTYGGAPLLGLTGLVVKTHGNSHAIEIQHSIEQCITFAHAGVNEQFISRMHLVDHTKQKEENGNG